MVCLQAPHLEFSLRLQLTSGEGQQRLQHHLLSEQAVNVGGVGRPLQREQQTPSHHQAVREDVGGLVERLADATRVVVQQTAVQLRGGRGAVCSVAVLLDRRSKLRSANILQLAAIQHSSQSDVWADLTMISREPL